MMGFAKSSTHPCCELRPPQRGPQSGGSGSSSRVDAPLRSDLVTPNDLTRNRSALRFS